jgi:leucyl/phenylalanyl-tRNA--protein transferase
MVRRFLAEGYFPMGEDDGTCNWYTCDPRGLLPVEGLHVPRSLRRLLRRGVYSVSFDTAFREVVESCRRGEDDWIVDEIVECYCAIHEEGWGHSAEAWLQGELVAGVYGVAAGALFCAESMFHRAPGAGNVALHALVEELGRQGFQVIDTQTTTPHLKRLGGFTVPRREYLWSVAEALRAPTPWGRAGMET